MTRRSLPVAAVAALLLLGGGVAGCGEDTVYDQGGAINENPSPTPVTPNPGLTDVGTAAPLPSADGAFLDGEEQAGGQGAD